MLFLEIEEESHLVNISYKTCLLNPNRQRKWVMAYEI